MSISDQLPGVQETAGNAPDRTINGLPGTGKTTTLLDIVEDELNSGVGLSDIAAVTYRKPMAKEFAERAAGRIGEDLPDNHWFKTTHAACYALLGLSREEVVDDEHRYRICKDIGVPYSGGTPDDEERPRWMKAPGGDSSTLGNQLFRLRSQCINTFTDPVTGWRSMPSVSSEVRQAIGGSPGLMERFNGDYEDWKASEGMSDFDDMLRRVNHDGITPPVDVLIEDEYQDKTPLQVAIHKQWADSVDRVYVAGDMFQAIYEFLGTDPRFMADAINAAADTVTLGKSYRFGPELWNFAIRILETVGHDPPDITPVGESTVERISWDGYRERVGEIPDEDTFHLVRANYLAGDVADVLIEAGVPYRNLRGGSEWSSRMIGLFNGTSRLYDVVSDSVDAFAEPDYNPLSYYDAKCVLPALKAKHFRGNKKPIVERLRADGEDEDDESDPDDLPLNEWLDPGSLTAIVEHPTPFDAMNPSQIGSTQSIRERIREAWVRRDGLPIGDLNHSVTTIHGAKGGEADTVFLLDGSTRRIQRNADPEAEAMVWFVGATRARENLYIVDTPTQSRRALPEVRP